MDLGLISGGAGGLSLALTANRMAAGAFFTLSGYHKLFNKARHASVTATLAGDGIPEVKVMQWFVPSVEFAGGLGVLFGFLAPVAALGLIGICLVATLVDGLKRIPAWKPLDRADYCDDVLYLPEVLYCIMLALVVAGGAGPLSIDALVF